MILNLTVLRYSYKIFLYFIILCCVTLSPLSCGNSRDKNNSYIDTVANLSGKRIVFPESLRLVSKLNKHNNTDSNIIAPNYKIIAYYGKGGCTSCRIKLKKWAQYIESLYPDNDTIVTRLIIIIPSEEERKIKYLAKCDNFNYDIMVDTDDKFRNTNNISSNTHLNSYLLNNNDEIIAVGNPINNKKIGNLYRKLITEGTDK